MLQFLNYVVTETIECRADHLKALVIAQAVFHRNPDDEGAENAVRTAAVRLRAALTAYYAREAGNRRVVIKLPKGRYVPEFEFQALPEAVTASPTLIGQRTIALSLLSLFTAAIIATVAIFCLIKTLLRVPEQPCLLQ